jgi:hypothetical protein
MHLSVKWLSGGLSHSWSPSRAPISLSEETLKISIIFQWGQSRHRPPNKIKWLSPIKGYSWKTLEGSER